jgi:cytochrome P450
LPSFVVGAQFVRRPLDSLLRWHALYGDIFTITFPGFGPGCYVADPEAIRELFTGDQSDLLAGEANSFLTPVLGRHSVLVLDGAEHLRHRRLLLPPFQGSHVTAFREVIREVAEAEVSRWFPGQDLVLRQRMRALTFEVICRAVFGVTEPARVERLRGALSAVIDQANIFVAPEFMRTDLGAWSPGGRLARALGAGDALVLEEIDLRRREGDLDERGDVLSLLLRARDEDGNGLSDAELRDELYTLLLAGHETTATGLSFALELLMRNPAVFERLRDELGDGVRGTSGDAYLDAVGQEALRLRPVIDAAERTLTKPRTVAGWELPAGTKVYPAIALVHHREDLYPRAREFRPERFIDEGATSYTWLPFGGGIRRCIGAALAQAEMSEVLRVVASRVAMTPLRDEPDPIVLKGVTLAPKHGVPVRIDAVAPTVVATAAAGVAA